MGQSATEGGKLLQFPPPLTTDSDIESKGKTRKISTGEWWFESSINLNIPPVLLSWEPSTRSNLAESKVMHISRLGGKMLARPIELLVEPDGDGVLVTAPDLPEIYGWDETTAQAIDSFKYNLEDLIDDLKTEAALSEPMEKTKAFLQQLLGEVF